MSEDRFSHLCGIKKTIFYICEMGKNGLVATCDMKNTREDLNNFRLELLNVRMSLPKKFINLK
jgi:hypothetical protein